MKKLLFSLFIMISTVTYGQRYIPLDVLKDFFNKPVSTMTNELKTYGFITSKNGIYIYDGPDSAMIAYSAHKESVNYFFKNDRQTYDRYIKELELTNFKVKYDGVNSARENQQIVFRKKRVVVVMSKTELNNAGYYNVEITTSKVYKWMKKSGAWD
jgi:hypothetical protein